MTANIVPVCSITSSSVICGEEASSPISFSATTTCAELETGSSSARPCTRARIMTLSMSILKVIILALVQGLAELLPVSSSAHVGVAEKLMGLDASSPPMTLLLVMLHTGTMFAVIVYFWNQWKKTYFSSGDAFKRFLVRLVWASLLTAV